VPPRSPQLLPVLENFRLLQSCRPPFLSFAPLPFSRSRFCVCLPTSRSSSIDFSFFRYQPRDLTVYFGGPTLGSCLFPFIRACCGGPVFSRRPLVGQLSTSSPCKTRFWTWCCAVRPPVTPPPPFLSFGLYLKLFFVPRIQPLFFSERWGPPVGLSFRGWTVRKVQVPFPFPNSSARWSFFFPGCRLHFHVFF